MPRIVYSLHFVTENPAPAGGMPVEFIVPLDRQGNGAGNIRPLGKPRVVDLRPGDEFVHWPTQKRYKLKAMSAYRQHTLTQEMIAAGRIPPDG
jgi:hypothetical protein